MKNAFLLVLAIIPAFVHAQNTTYDTTISELENFKKGFSDTFPVFRTFGNLVFKKIVTIDNHAVVKNV